MKLAIVPVGVLGLCAAAHATVYGLGPGGAIPQAITTNVMPGTLTSEINAPGPWVISSFNSVTLTFGPPNHTFCGDIVATLTAPNGEDVHLFARLGVTAAAPTGSGDSSDLGGAYVFSESGAAGFFLGAAQTAGDNVPIPPGTYLRTTSDGPNVPGGHDNDNFSVFAGDGVGGVWTLTLEDWFAGDTGSLASWSFDATVIGVNPCPANIVTTGSSATSVDVDDLLLIISAWGSCPAPPALCPANVVTTGTSATRVDVDDMLFIISNWGPCP